jgi:hypothetical protein
MAKKDSNFNPIGRTRGLRSRNGGIADWQSANSNTLIRAIATAAVVGGALRCGYSRDGGAYAIGIYGDGEPYTVFVKPGEDIDIILEDIIDLFESIKHGGAAP